jgi:hypothetical protein
MMKNPLRHHDQVRAAVTERPHWRHMQADVDPDCVRDPGSDLWASWDLEGAADDALRADEWRRPRDRRSPLN